MHLVKTSITLPDDLLQEARSMSRNVSGLVTEALREYIRQRKVQKAMESFGSWKSREGDSVDIVNDLRTEEGRDYAGRSH
ncbi:MAG: type II toxin-antitoxin system CcdA family antitoxin [Steroidobacteraceae bacterium]|nr:type II toxin-antitoxin system CcdA family antitoxin [Deltaproteobacteria bacterium]